MQRCHHLSAVTQNDNDAQVSQNSMSLSLSEMESLD